MDFLRSVSNTLGIGVPIPNPTEVEKTGKSLAQSMKTHANSAYPVGYQFFTSKIDYNNKKYVIAKTNSGLVIQPMADWKKRLSTGIHIDNEGKCTIAKEKPNDDQIVANALKVGERFIKSVGHQQAARQIFELIKPPELSNDRVVVMTGEYHRYEIFHTDKSLTLRNVERSLSVDLYVSSNDNITSTSLFNSNLEAVEALSIYYDTYSDQNQRKTLDALNKLISQCEFPPGKIVDQYFNWIPDVNSQKFNYCLTVNAETGEAAKKIVKEAIGNSSIKVHLAEGLEKPGQIIITCSINSADAQTIAEKFK